VDFSVGTGTIPQWGAFGSLLGLLAMAVTVWIKGIPERLRVRNEGVALQAKIEEDLRGEAALRFQEFRNEVHDLRNELQAMSSRLSSSETTSRRRADKLSMMIFILHLVMSELRRLDKDSEVLQRAEMFLNQIEPESGSEHELLKEIKPPTDSSK
jgi:uncharacterized membrane protein YccC